MRIPIFILFSCALRILVAQNWQPFTFDEAYYYYSDTSDNIDFGYRLDQIDVDGTDTIGYFNRILFTDTIIGCVKDSVQYWGGKMEKMAGGVYLFSEPYTKVLHTQAQPGNFWTFTSDPPVTAQVLSMDTATFFGVLDSVKCIKLSNGDSILLSKSFGLIAFPSSTEPEPVYQHLSGINGRDVGVRLPDFTDYFDWQAGDLFQWERISGWNDMSDFGWDQSLYKLEVLNASVNDTVATIEVVGNVFYTHIEEYAANNYTSIYPFHDTIDIYASENSFTTAMPYQFVKLNINMPNITSEDAYIDFFKTYGHDSMDRVYIYDPYTTEDEETIVIQQFDTLFCANTDIQYFNVRYTVGLGCTSWQSRGVETAESFKLTAYRKAGDTVGVFLEDTDFVAQVIVEDVVPFTVFPNPAGDYINCAPTGQPGTDMQYFICDGVGKVVYSGIAYANLDFQINISSLPTGIYFIAMADELNNHFIARFIKSD